MGGRQSILKLVFFLLVADVLATGLVTGANPASDEAVPIFYILLSWLAPLTFHFHHSLLDRPPNRTGRITLGVLYALGALASFVLLLDPMPALRQYGWFIVLRMGIRLELVPVLALAWLLLWREYRNGVSLAIRGRIRLITFGTLFAFTPLLLLSLIPETLGAPVFVPYEYTFPCLLLSPLAYAYSLFRRRLGKAEVGLNRTAVYYLLILLLFSAYLVSAAVAGRLTANTVGDWTLFNALLSVVLLLLFVPLKQAIQKLITWVLYGGEITYVGVVTEPAEQLSITLDRESLRRLLVNELASALHLSRCMLLLRDQENLAVLGTIGFDAQPGQVYQMPAEARLIAFLETTGEPVTQARAQKTMAALPMFTDEQKLLSADGAAIWLPLLSGGILQGLLLLGSRAGADLFNPEEERILTTLSYQGGIAAHNMRLIEEARAREQELSRAHRQLILAREQEQRRLANELHDGAVQQLLALSHQIYQNQRGRGNRKLPVAQHTEPLSLEAIREGVVGVVTQLRELIGELRPAGLEEFGLAAALEGYVAQLEREEGSRCPRIVLELDEDGRVPLPEPVVLCLFRSAQESLRNALKRASARRIQLSLYVNEQEAELSVQDDGCGFRVPAHLGELAKTNHFGLIGMAERAGWVSGELTVSSKAGAGTEVMVRIPLDKVNEDNGKPNSSAAGR